MKLGRLGLAVCALGLAGNLFAADALTGSWVFTKENGQEKSADTVTFANENDFTYENKSYNDGIPTVSSTMKATYALGDKNAIDITFVSLSMTLHVEDYVNYFNANNVFGYSDWKVNEAKDITGKAFQEGEQALPNKDDKYFSVYGTDAGKLFLGKDTEGADGKTAETRHTELDKDMPYSKVP